MLDHILVPLDGSPLAECVLPHLAAVAPAFQADVTLLHVQEQSNPLGQAGSVDPLDWHISRVEAESYLDRVAARLREANVATHPVLLEGPAADQILDFANANKIDLLLLSSHGSSGLSGWNVSSIVQKIILRAVKSILLVRAYQRMPAGLSDLHYHRILVPLDGSQRAECVLSPLTSLATAHDSEIVLAHVVRQPEMPRRAPLTQQDLELVEHLTQRNREEASAYLEQLQPRLPQKVETRLLVSENVTAALQDLVEQEQADLVLMSAHGYSGQAKWPYGSTVISFIAYGTTPLLIIQDLPQGELPPTPAELAASQHKGH